MEEKTKNRRDWMGLLLEFVVVVVGIAITFAGESVISDRQEQNDLKATLALVREELMEDLASVHSIDSSMKEELDAVNFLWKNQGKYESCNQDSLWKYCNLPFYVILEKDRHEAFELMKNTGLFAKIKDKELALDIMHAYGKLHEYETSCQFFADKKIKMADELTNLPQFRALFANQGLSAAEFWNRIMNDEHGNYFLREMRNQLSSRVDTGNVVNSVSNVIERIEDYCR